MQEALETWVQSLGWEDPLEEEMAICSIFFPVKSQGQRSLVGCSLWGHKETNTWASPGALMVEKLPPVWEIQV